jgi:amino-acid N-acetyltransferase
MDEKVNEIEFVVSTAQSGDLASVQNFLEPFMDDRQLLKRTSIELELLLKHAFKATQADGTIVAFCALEIYSKKLAEIQCLAVSPDFRRKGLGAQLVKLCVERAREEKVKELMAISASEEMFVTCGFDYSLPNQKRALFIQP